MKCQNRGLFGERLSKNGSKLYKMGVNGWPNQTNHPCHQFLVGAKLPQQTETLTPICNGCMLGLHVWFLSSFLTLHEPHNPTCLTKLLGGGGVNGYSSLVPLQGIRKWAHYIIIICGRKSVNKLINFGPNFDWNYPFVIGNFLKFGPFIAQIWGSFEKLIHSYLKFCIK